MKTTQTLLTIGTLFVAQANAFVILNDGFDTPATWTPSTFTTLAVGSATEVAATRTPPLLGTIAIDDWSYDILNSEARGWNSATGVVGPPPLMPQTMPQCVQFFCRAGGGGGGGHEGGGGPGGCGFRLFGTLDNLTINDVYDVTFFHKVLGGTFDVVVEDFTTGAFNGRVDGTDINSSVSVGLSGTASNIWDSTTVRFTATSTTHQIHIFGGGTGYDQYFDSFSINSVPEPGASLLGALGALLLLRRKR